MGFTMAQPASAQPLPVGSLGTLCSVVPLLCPAAPSPPPSSAPLSPPTLVDSSQILNNIGLNINTNLSGPTLDFGDVDVHVLDNASLNVNVTNTLSGLLGNVQSGDPALFLRDTLRLSAGASVDGLLGIDAFGNSAYLVDHFRVSAQGENDAVASLPNPDSLAYVSDDFRSSGPTITSSLDGLAGADVLGTETHVVDALRLSGQASNSLVGVLLPSEGNLAYASDTLRLSDQALMNNLASITSPAGGTYLVDTLRLSNQVQNDVLANILSDQVSDDLRATVGAVATGVLGTTGPSTSTPIVKRSIIDQLRLILHLS